MKLITQYRGLKKEIYILFVGQLVTSMGSYVWPMLTFFLTAKLGLSDSLTTLLFAISTLLTLPASWAGGKLADRFSRKNVIICFDLLTVTFYILAAIMPIGYNTAVIIFIAGLFQTLEGPAYDALSADFSSSEQRERAYSLSYLGFNLGFILGASISGILFREHIRLAFLLNASAILISTLLIVFFIHMRNAITNSEESLEESYTEYEMPIDSKASVFQIFKPRMVILFMMIMFRFVWMPSHLSGILLPLQLKTGLGEYGATLYGYLNSVNGIVVVIFTPIFSILLKKLTEIPKTALGLLLFLAGCFLFSIGNSKPLLFIGMIIFTMGEVVSVLGGNPYTSRRVPASHRGRVGGFASIFGTVFAAISELAVSLLLRLTESNYKLLWNILLIVGVCVFVLFIPVYRKDKKTFPLLYQKESIGQTQS